MARFPARRVGFLIWSVWLGVAALSLFVLPGTAHAAFPGDNGKIVFARGAGNIWAVNPDGTGETNLTNDPAGTVNRFPALSPDGKKVAFDRSVSSGPTGIYVMSVNGGAKDFVTSGQQPTWAPDGVHIAFERTGDIWKINRDTSVETRLTFDYPGPPCSSGNFRTNAYPEWSPTGDRIAFQTLHYDWNEDDFTCGPGGAPIESIRPDGSDRTRLFLTGATDLSWSPDGHRLAWACGGICVGTIGGTETRVKAEGGYPAWSPDGAKIAYSITIIGDTGIHLMNPDGSGEAHVTTGNYDLFGDWQPLKPYPRPVGASPLEVTLVPAFRPCETTNADARHGQPLAFPSCSNPTPTSSTVRIGPNTLSLMRIVVCPSNASSAFCNPTAGMPKPDVRFTGSIRDIHCATTVPLGCTAGADYNPNTTTGPYTDGGNGKGGAQPPCLPSASSTTACLAGADLTEVAEIPGASIGGSGTQFEGRGVRITDRSNIPATVTDIGFPVPLDCIPNPSSSQGSACGVNTTANALVPGVVGNGDTAVWQIGQIELKDSGPDGVRGNSDDEVFAVQGLFLP